MKPCVIRKSTEVTKEDIQSSIINEFSTPEQPTGDIYKVPELEGYIYENKGKYYVTSDEIYEISKSAWESTFDKSLNIDYKKVETLPVDMAPLNDIIVEALDLTLKNSVK